MRALPSDHAPSCSSVRCCSCEAWNCSAVIPKSRNAALHACSTSALLQQLASAALINVFLAKRRRW
jgi:hypothetical protein